MQSRCLEFATNAIWMKRRLSYPAQVEHTKRTLVESVKTETTVTFLGGAGTVTGSKYLVNTGGSRILVDCGLFQGRKPLRRRNWQALPVEVGSLDAVLLTHAHLDHSGYIPVLTNSGYDGPVYCTSGTRALAGILLPDSGNLQEEDARYAWRKGFSRHSPPLPLYTRADAAEALTFLEAIAFEAPVEVAPGIVATFRSAGHILGASSIHLQTGTCSIPFSGDIGRPGDPVMKPPAPPVTTDYLVVESTYGNRHHDDRPPLDCLRDITNETLERNGILLIPSFAVGRAQSLLYLLAELRRENAIPDVPVYLNSPMSNDATQIYCRHMSEHRLNQKSCEDMCASAYFVNSSDESRSLNRHSGPMIVISASGMATGGRVLHHLKAWLGDSRNTVLFAGFQAPGTLGATLLSGRPKVRIHGHDYSVKAQIAEVSGLSAHADQDELIEWLAPLAGQAPTKLFITHGEPPAANAFAERITSDYGFSVAIPASGEQWTLS